MANSSTNSLYEDLPGAESGGSLIGGSTTPLKCKLLTFKQEEILVKNRAACEGTEGVLGLREGSAVLRAQQGRTRGQGRSDRPQGLDCLE